MPARLRPELADLPAYTPGKTVPGAIKIASNETVHGPLPSVRVAVEKGRGTSKKLKLGICGEHGGDPASIALCQELGLDYVSCSPFRVPVARLAAAQAIVGASTADTR